MTIVPPSGDPYTDAWTLIGNSTSYDDIGVWNVVLRASLTDWPVIASVTKSLTASVAHPCESTTINAAALSANDIEY